MRRRDPGPLRRRLALRYRLRQARAAAAERVKLARGIPIRMETPDRAELEERILPWLASRDDLQRILFVGVGPYTKHYEAFFRGRVYRTIDLDARRRRYGAGHAHIVGSLTELDRWFEPESLDLVVINGVLGFGLNDKEEIERAIELVRRALREGGLLLLGWDDNPPRRPVYPEEIGALSRFEPSPVPLYDGWRHVVEETPYRKTYDFYRRRTPDES